MFGFENVENKLKILAKINLICGYILAAIILIYSLFKSLDEKEIGLFIFGVLLAGLWLLIGYVTSWCLYAFAEMVGGIKESSKSLREIRINTAKNDRQKVLEEEQRKAAEEARLVEQKREEERKAAERLAAQKRAEERRAAEEQAEKVRKERFNAYWTEHADEKEKLLAKKAAAEKKLKGLSSLAVEERKTIQELIQAIEYELTKER